MRLQEAALAVPHDCMGAIEVRLDPSATPERSPVDLSVRICRATQARALAERIASPALRLFLDRWADGTIPHSAVPAVWLEYDLDRRRAPKTPIACARLAADLDPGWLTQRLLPSLCGGPVPHSRRRLVGTCLDALPDGLRPLYLFDLQPRGAGEVRLELYTEDPSVLAGYLRRVAPAEATRRVAHLVPLVERCDRFHLSIDLGTEVSSRIGLEAAFRHLPQRDPRWRELCVDLVVEGLCSRDRAEAVLDWPGYDSIWTALDRWPGGDGARGGRPGGHAVRSLSHFKLVSSSRDPAAKAYLLFQHVP